MNNIKIIKLHPVRITLILLIMINLIVIHQFSADDAVQSNNMSTQISESMLSKFDADFRSKTDSEKDIKVKSFNSKFRESAHAIEYLPLGLLFVLLVMTYMPKRGLVPFVKACIISIFIIVVFAYGDELFQKSIDGRAFQISDIFRDVFGALAGMVIAAIIELALYFKKSKRM